MPESAEEPFNMDDDGFDYIGALRRFLTDFFVHLSVYELSKRGLRELAESDSYNSKQRAEAKREVERDFPTLNHHITVLMWGALEALIEDFLTSWLVCQAEAWEIPQLQDIKLTVADWFGFSDEEKAAFILNELGRTKIKDKVPIGRLDAMLAGFGFSAQIDEETRKGLHELSQIRNVLVHRSSRADKKLIAACPWLRYKVGEDVRVSTADVERYDKSTRTYVYALMSNLHSRLETANEAASKAASSPP